MPSIAMLAILGSLLVVGIILGVICCHILRKRQQAANMGEQDMVGGIEDKRGGSQGSGHQHVVGVTELMRSSNPAIIFSYNDVKVATNDFSRLIGSGGFGSVYFGTLRSGASVAVKVLSESSNQGVQEFLNEVSLLCRIHHKNLVDLVGYCIETKLVLVYEYLSNGNLQNWLYGETYHSLTWRERVKIAVDAAQGLSYLHTGCNPRIIHRDMKASNILLNEKMEGKISDFGISKITQANELGDFTTVKGSYGYIDPEYLKTQTVTDKTDIYSFGVVLLEIICGMPPVNAGFPEGQRHLTGWVGHHVQRGSIQMFMDPKMAGRYDVSSAWKVVETAMACVGEEARHRPSIDHVCRELHEAYHMLLLPHDVHPLDASYPTAHKPLDPSATCSQGFVPYAELAPR